MLTPAQKDHVLTVLKDTEAALQKNIDMQYQIKSEEEAFSFFDTGTTALYCIQDNVKALLQKLQAKEI